MAKLKKRIGEKKNKMEKNQKAICEAIEKYGKQHSIAWYDAKDELERIKKAPSKTRLNKIVVPALTHEHWQVREVALEILGEHNARGQYDSIIKRVAESDDNHILRSTALYSLSGHCDMPIHKTTGLHYLPDCCEDIPMPKITAQKSINLDQLVSQVIEEGYDSSYKPSIFYAQSQEEFTEKIEEHFRRAGKQMPKGFNSNCCFYSLILKECLIHPMVVQFLESQGNDLDAFNKLRFFEYSLHEVTHGLIDKIGQDEDIIPSNIKNDKKKMQFYFEFLKPLVEEYVVSMSAHQLTADYANQITGGMIIPGLFDAFTKQNRASSLTEDLDKIMGKIFSQVGETDEQISRYFITHLNSKEGLRDITEIFFRSQNWEEANDETVSEAK